MGKVFIIAEAGVNLAAIHYHFGSKEELLDEMVRLKVAPVNEKRLERLERAITEAGGVKTDAQTSQILVIRRDDTGAVRAYQAVLAPLPGSSDPILKSFDVVYVPQTVIGSINEFMASYVKNLPFAATRYIAPVSPATVLIPQVTTPH